MKEKVLVTGGAGYLGNVIMRQLLSQGYHVTCLDNLMYHQQNTIISLVSHPNFEFVYGDVRDESLIRGIIQDKDVIIPLAAIVGAPACKHKPHDAETINKEAVIMINKLRRADQKLICPITNSGYGTKSGEVHCTEESLLEPITFYGKTKVDAETALLEAEIPAITLRLATVFGVSPRMRTDLMVNDFVLQAVTNKSIVLFEGDFKRNFVHIKDVARAFQYCIEHYDEMKGQAYNLGLDAANMSKRELAQKIKEHIPGFEIYESELGSDPDKRNYIVSNEKLRKAGFEAEVSIEEGITELISAYNILLRNNPHGNI